MKGSFTLGGIICGAPCCCSVLDPSGNIAYLALGPDIAAAEENAAALARLLNEAAPDFHWLDESIEPGGETTGDNVVAFPGAAR